MKLEEVKVGMRVGLCRAAAKREDFGEAIINDWEQEHFPGIIFSVRPGLRRILVSKIDTTSRGYFPPEWLALL